MKYLIVFILLCLGIEALPDPCNLYAITIAIVVAISFLAVKAIIACGLSYERQKAEILAEVLKKHEIK